MSLEGAPSTVRCQQGRRQRLVEPQLALLRTRRRCSCGPAGDRAPVRRGLGLKLAAFRARVGRPVLSVRGRLVVVAMISAKADLSKGAAELESCGNRRATAATISSVASVATTTSTESADRPLRRLTPC